MNGNISQVKMEGGVLEIKYNVWLLMESYNDNGKIMGNFKTEDSCSSWTCWQGTGSASMLWLRELILKLHKQFKFNFHYFEFTSTTKAFVKNSRLICQQKPCMLEYTTKLDLNCPSDVRVITLKAATQLWKGIYWYRQRSMYLQLTGR